ncbi:MAG: N-acylneuraminate cytidylyltransferase [Verrucomicrobia bacterium]|nr:N-acylneuraminate cytidylyltransferase [Verrucomicrobiota bacterium]
MKVLGIIPARGGSKTVPRKNICLVAGKPLIVYSVECAKRSAGLARCIVSTDSPEIADLCRQAGADVPFLRPAELAGDATPTLPVLLHALDHLTEAYDAVMILQPTSPLRQPGDVDSAIRLLDSDPSADSVISVVKVGDHHPARMKQIRAGVLIDPPFAESMEGQRRQDLSEYYLRNGAIYLTRTQVLRQQGSLKGRKSLAYVMPEERSVNIDGQMDLLLAEALLLSAARKR